MDARGGERLLFDGFELEPANGVLRKDGTVLKLAPQPFRALTFLAGRPGTLVTREELRQAIWDDDVTVDFEHGLNTCLRQIRLALGEEAESPRIIETVPRLGYRFKPVVTRETSARRDRRWAWAGAGVMLLVIAVGWWKLAKGNTVAVTAGTLRSHPARSSHWWPTESPEAYAKYLSGRSALERLTRGGSESALRLFEQAIALAPNYAEAHAGIADAYADLNYTGGLAPTQAHQRAAQALARAMALQESLPEVHMAAALVKERFERDWKGAERELREAIDLDPNNAGAHERYALLLSLIGRPTEALKEARIAEALDPLSPRRMWTVALVLYYARRYDDAIAQVQRTLEIDPTFDAAYQTLAQCHQGKAQLDEAIQAYLRFPRSFGNLGHAYAEAGRTPDAKKVLADAEKRHEQIGVGSTQIAMIYAGLGEPDHAFEWLETAYREEAWLGTLKVAPVWDRLRRDPRFAQVLEKTHFEDVR